MPRISWFPETGSDLSFFHGSRTVEACRGRASFPIALCTHLILCRNARKVERGGWFVDRTVPAYRKIEYEKMACERNQERIANVACIRDVAHDGGESGSSDDRHH